MANLCANYITRPNVGAQWLLDNVTWATIAGSLMEKQRAGILTDTDIDQAISDVRSALGDFIAYLGVNKPAAPCVNSAEWKRAIEEETAFAERMISGWEAFRAGTVATGTITQLLPPSIGKPLSQEVVKGSGITWSWVVLGIAMLLVLFWLWR